MPIGHSFLEGPILRRSALFLSIQKIRQNVLYARTPPKKTALSLAIGIGLAFGPLPGLHLIGAFVLTRVFRLNGLVMVTGVFVHNPWTMIPIHGLGLVLGDLLLHGHLASIENFQMFPWEDIGFFTLFKREFWQTNGQVFLTLLPSFLIGSTISALVTGISTYQITVRYLTRNLAHASQQNPST